MDVVIEIVMESLLWTLFGGSILAIATGIWLLVSPASFISFSVSANRWVSTRQAAQWLEAPRSIERFFYRHHRPFGAILVAGAALALYYSWFELDAARTVATLALPWQGPTVEIVADAMLGFLVLGNTLVLGIGLIVFVRPSLLKRVESASNRWISTRRLFKALDNQSDLPDRLVARQPRLLGTVLIVGGLYATLQLGLFIR